MTPKSSASRSSEWFGARGNLWMVIWVKVKEKAPRATSTRDPYLQLGPVWAGLGRSRPTEATDRSMAQRQCILHNQQDPEPGNAWKQILERHWEQMCISRRCLATSPQRGPTPHAKPFLSSIPSRYWAIHFFWGGVRCSLTNGCSNKSTLRVWTQNLGGENHNMLLRPV